MTTSVVRLRNRSRQLFPSMILALFVLAMPLSAFAEDQQSIEALRRMGNAFASIAEKASPAVVGIRAVKVSSGRAREYSDGNPFNPFGDEDLFDYFFRRQSPRRSPRPQPRQVAQGSGFIVTEDGYILTNNHLVGETEEITVQLDDGRKLSAEVVGTDPETDVAVIKIDAADLPHLELSNSDDLQVGEWVIAIGNPFGLSHTVTAGIVSAKGRSRIGVADYEDFIQTDAAINFGNSGGPLLNLDSEVIGINTAIIGPGGNVGIGLAIPINMARAIYEQLRETGTVVRGFLGVGIDDLEPGMGEFFDFENGKGVIVTSVMDDSAAEKAGIKADDVVVELEGESVASANELMNRVAMYKPGSKVKLKVLRDGKPKAITVTLGTRPQDGSVAVGSRSKTQEQLGLSSVQTLTDELAEQLGYEGLSGVLVMEVEPGSLAAEEGLRAGTLILEVNRESVRNVRQFNEALAKAQDMGKVLLRVRYDEWTRLVFLRLPER